MSAFTDLAKGLTHPEGAHLSVKKVMEQYPNGITICEVLERDYSDNKAVLCVKFVESPNTYTAFTATALKAFVSGMAEKFGTLDKLNDALAKENIRIKITTVKTKKGYTAYGINWLGYVNTETGEIFSD